MQVYLAICAVQVMLYGTAVQQYNGFRTEEMCKVHFFLGSGTTFLFPPFQCYGGEIVALPKDTSVTNKGIKLRKNECRCTIRFVI